MKLFITALVLGLLTISVLSTHKANSLADTSTKSLLTWSGVTSETLCEPNDDSYTTVTAPTTGNQYKVMTPTATQAQKQIVALGKELSGSFSQSVYDQYNTLIQQNDTCSVQPIN